MAERAGAAVDVDLLVRQAEVAHRRHGDDGEGLVDLEQIDGIRAPAGLLEQLFQRADRRGGEIFRRGGVGRMRDDAREGRCAALLGFAFAHHDERRGAVGDRARIGRRHRAAVAERRLERRDLFGRPLGGCSSVATSVSDLPAFTLTGAISQAKSPFVDRAVGALERAQRIGVLRLPCELIGFRAILGERPHEPPLVVGVLEAVEKHVIEGAAVAHAIARARAVEQIGRVAHALHAAGDHDIGASPRAKGRGRPWPPSCPSRTSC